MNKFIAIGVFLSALLFSKSLIAQDLIDDISSLEELNNYQTIKKQYQVARKNKNEVQLLLSGSFLFYKRFISSQDASSCAFHQSCSEYALTSIKKQGVVLGGINFFDRFTRCNSCSPYLYKKNPESGKLLDYQIEVNFK